MLSLTFSKKKSKKKKKKKIQNIVSRLPLWLASWGSRLIFFYSELVAINLILYHWSMILMTYCQAETEEDFSIDPVGIISTKMFDLSLEKHAVVLIRHFKTVHHVYRIYHMYSDRQAWANSIDPDETPQNAASHLDLHCLPLIQQFLDTTSGSELYWFKF